LKTKQTKISLMKAQIFFNIIMRLGLLEDEAKETTGLRNVGNYLFIRNHCIKSQKTLIFTSTAVISSYLGHG